MGIGFWFPELFASTVSVFNSSASEYRLLIWEHWAHFNVCTLMFQFLTMSRGTKIDCSYSIELSSTNVHHPYLRASGCPGLVHITLSRHLCCQPSYKQPIITPIFTNLKAKMPNTSSAATVGAHKRSGSTTSSCNWQRHDWDCRDLKWGIWVVLTFLCLE